MYAAAVSSISTHMLPRNTFDKEGIHERGANAAENASD